MFFIAIFGITNGEKELNWYENRICGECGRMSRYYGYMTYSVFTLFFIPIFKFAKKYYVKSSCCGALFEVPQDKGRKMEKGEDVHFTDGELRKVYGGRRFCDGCGYPLEEGQLYCPHCGRKI